MIVTLQLRFDTSASLIAANEVYAKGEPIWEEDTGRIRIGNGISRYTDLVPVSYDPSLLQALSNTAVTAAASAEAAANRAVAAAGGGTLATTTAPGVLKVATEADVNAGTPGVLAVTAERLAARLAGVTGAVPATTAVAGILPLATNTEAADGINATKAITPATLASRLASFTGNTVSATTTQTGIMRYATTAEAVTGVASDRAVTPEGVAAALNSFRETIALAGSLSSLSDTAIPTAVFDQQGIEVTPGPQNGDALVYNAATAKWVPKKVDPSLLADDTRYLKVADLPVGFNYFVPQYVLRTATDTVPADFPTYGIITDLTNQDLGLFEDVNIVASATGTVQLPALATATRNDITQTGNVTLGFPGAARGARLSIMVRENATGGYSLTFPSGIVWPGGAAPTRSTTANTSARYEFVSDTGSSWVNTQFVQYGVAAAAKAAPTYRAAFGGNTGASNTSNTATASLPASGVTATDIGYMLVSWSDVLPPTNLTVTTSAAGQTWTRVEGPQSQTSMSTYLYRKTGATADNGATVTVTATDSAGAAVAARLGIAGIYVAGGTTTGEVRVAHTDSAQDTNLETALITPSADQSLLIDISSIRYVSSTSPTTTPPADWTQRHHLTENRSASVNYAGHIMTKTLSGNGGLEQPVALAAYSAGGTALNGTDQGWTIAVPPA